jgi:ribosome modulation factor
MKDPTEAMIAAGAHALSEWIDDEAPLHEQRYRNPAKAAWAAMRAAAPPVEARAEAVAYAGRERMAMPRAEEGWSWSIVQLRDAWLDGWRAARASLEQADMRRFTGLWRWGINVLPPAQITDFYAWLALLDAAIDERTRRDRSTTSGR